MKPLLVYLFIMNAAGITVMHRDKVKARKKQWRIPETVLLGIALMGGSFGILAGMQLFRHKTLHLKFSIGVPLIFALQAVLAIFTYLLLFHR